MASTAIQCAASSGRPTRRSTERTASANGPPPGTTSVRQDRASDANAISTRSRSSTVASSPPPILTMRSGMNRLPVEQQGDSGRGSATRRGHAQLGGERRDRQPGAARSGVADEGAQASDNGTPQRWVTGENPVDRGNDAANLRVRNGVRNA